jgi:hypothetical protein
MKRLADLSLALALVASCAFVGLTCALEAGCATHANAPATVNLSATGLADYNKTRFIAVIDIIRDAALDGEKVGAFAHADTVNIVTWHKSTVQVLAASGAGWKAAAQTALDELVKHLSAAAKAKVAPYVPLATAILQEV